jgi:hypothetical protein
VVKGTARAASDIDLLVELDPDHTPTLFGIAGIEIELTDMLGRKVDLRTAGDLSRYFRDEASRKYLDWQSILADRTHLDLTPYQVTQAETQRGVAASTMLARIPEAYQWLLVPVQAPPQSPVTREASRLSVPAALAVCASKKPPQAAKPKRFHGTVLLDATRVGRDAGRIAEEAIAHLDGLVHAKVTVTLEIEAEMPDGAPEHVVRTVTENCRTLKFTRQGLKQE